MGIVIRIAPSSVAIAVLVMALVLVVACGGAATQEISPPLSPPLPTVDATQQSTQPSPTASTVAPAQQPTQPLSTETATQQLAQPTSTAGEIQSPTSTPEMPGVTLERVFQKFTFSRLTNLVAAGGRLFVTEQTGRVISLAGNPNSSETPESVIFLDIREQVDTDGTEVGLLGLAFDPGFDSNGHFYVYYSAGKPRRSVVSRFTGTAGPGNAGKAEPDSELVIMEIAQPYENHNGGQLAFGPDGMLYISLGDGGSGGDPRGNGQNASTLLGTILRIDVSNLRTEGGYQVPPDNPFVGVPDARDEIWAYGLRNPWRFSFDRQNGDLWAGDVGQTRFEEVDLVLRGGNYGWNKLEGNHCFSPPTGCDPSGTLLPVIEYGSNKGCSVIGGYVYRGTRIPSLAGTYLYGDFCAGEIHGFRFENGEVAGHSMLVKSGFMITSFGEDERGEIYVLSGDGGIYRLISVAP